MKIIVIKTQKELDDLPKTFDVFTRIEIRADEHIEIGQHYSNSQITAWNNSKVTAYDNSQITAYDNSQITAYDNSQVTALNQSFCRVRSIECKIKAYENAGIFLHANSEEIEIFDNATVKKIQDVRLDFDTWVSRGFVVADGIYRKYISHKKENNIEIYETDRGFVARKDNVFAHGDTELEARTDLAFKLSDRDTSKYKDISIDEKLPISDLVLMYRTITGACSQGTRDFMRANIKEEKYSIKEVIEITKGAYGHEEFKNFFSKEQVK